MQNSLSWRSVYLNSRGHRARSLFFYREHYSTSDWTKTDPSWLLTNQLSCIILFSLKNPLRLWSCLYQKSDAEISSDFLEKISSLLIKETAQIFSFSCSRWVFRKKEYFLCREALRSMNLHKKTSAMSSFHRDKFNTTIIFFDLPTVNYLIAGLVLYYLIGDRSLERSSVFWLTCCKCCC